MMTQWLNNLNVSGGKRFVGPAFTMLLGLTILFGFQNCSAPLDPSATNESTGEGKSMPFAFDTKVDHIAYMSCSNMPTGYNPRAYFTFRGGSYNSDSGIMLSEAFLAAAGSMSADKKADAVRNSPENAGARLQMSIRTTSDYQSVLQAGSTAKENYDFSNILSFSLDSLEVGNRLAGRPPGFRTNYFPGISGLDGKLIEGSVRFLESEVTAASVRSHMESTGVLAFTYTDGAEANNIEAKGDTALSANSVYGVGYQMSFNLGFGINNSNASSHPGYTNGVRRVMRNIREIDMKTRASTTAVWDCPSEMTFVIVRPEDIQAGRVNCEVGAEAPLSNISPAYRDAYQALRNVLRIEDWWVNVVRRCIVPKSGAGSACYQNNSTAMTINYSGGSCSDTGTTNRCPHYVSICVRR